MLIVDISGEGSNGRAACGRCGGDRRSARRPPAHGQPLVWHSTGYASGTLASLAHTAEGALDFILDLVDRVETTLCQVALVHIDAGFPDEKLLAVLEANGTPYVARIKNNKVLDRLVAPHLRRPPGRPPAEPRVWFHEMIYAAGSWSRLRRVVLVVLEQPDDLLLRHFWLLTSINANTLDG
jgi:Transposase DDE domain group 1